MEFVGVWTTRTTAVIEGTEVTISFGEDGLGGLLLRLGLLLCGSGHHFLLLALDNTTGRRADLPGVAAGTPSCLSSFLRPEFDSCATARSSPGLMPSWARRASNSFLLLSPREYPMVAPLANACTMWKRLYAYFTLHEEAWKAHYHKRSNVETVFSMVKGKFGDCVRSKSETGQVNEVLFKFLCHNICCLIQAMYQRGLTPNFEAQVRPEEKVGWLNLKSVSSGT